MNNNNWQVEALGEVCDILDSRRIPITKRDRIAGPYPYYGASGIQDYVDKYIFDEKLILIGEDGAKWGAGENTAFVVEGKYWVNNHAHVVRPDRNRLLDNWLVYFLNFSDLQQYITGLTVPKLNQEKMRSILFPLPPIDEQRRIVAILDESSSSIEKAKQLAQRKVDLLDEMTKSILSKAFEGNL